MIEDLLLSHLPAWLGIAFCISQSAMFSGLNLAIFSVSRLRLEVRAAGGDADAARLLALRRQSNLTLATVLWGNVSVNVLLTLFSGSVLTGISAFFFSTFVITTFGEIAPQAYFSRHALRIAALLGPWLRIYQLLLYPVARPTALVLDAWLGPEPIAFFGEQGLRVLIAKHAQSAGTGVGALEATGAINFLDLDDVAVLDEGEPVDPRSIIELPIVDGRAQLPDFARSPADPFLQRLDASGKKWVIIVDPSGQPRLVLDAHHFLRDALFGREALNPAAYCHRPLIVREPRTPLGEVLGRMRVTPQHPEDDVIDDDLILVWGKARRVITGADLLGRLLRGITAKNVDQR